MELMAGNDTLFCLRGSAIYGRVTEGRYVKAFRFDFPYGVAAVAIATCNRCSKKHVMAVENRETVSFPMVRSDFEARFEGTRLTVECRVH